MTTTKGLALTALLSLLPSVPAFAVGGFSGAFDVGTPDIYTVSGPAGTLNTAAGNWTVDTQAFSSSAVATVDTTGAPNSVSLFANLNLLVAAGSHAAPAGQGPSEFAIAELSIVAPSAGTFAFDVTGSVNLGVDVTGDVYAFVGLTHYSLVSESSYSLPVAAGESFGFGAEAHVQIVGASGGRPGLSGLPGLADPGAGSNLVVSNVVFTPVPEASTISAGLALLGMGAFAWNRSRRRS